MYNPSENYDESCAHDYGAYKTNDTCDILPNCNITASFEDLTESKQRSTISINSSSSSSLSKSRNNNDDALLNYDDTESECDEDEDECKKASDDKRIFVKELNYVKGRQVGLLIGPFGILIYIDNFHFYIIYFRSTHHTNSRTNWCQNSSDK